MIGDRSPVLVRVKDPSFAGTASGFVLDTDSGSGLWGFF